MTKNSKQKEGLQVLVDFLRYTFLGSAFLIVLLQTYIYFTSEEAKLMEQLQQMAGAIYPLLAFLMITMLKKQPENP